jgi:hypothetical protein
MPEAAAVTIPIFPARRIDPPLDPSVRVRFYTASGSSDTTTPWGLELKPEGQGSPAAGCGILLPWRCKEISDEVPEVRVANQADGNEEDPDEVSRVVHMLESQV